MGQGRPARQAKPGRQGWKTMSWTTIRMRQHSVPCTTPASHRT
jgi:hypothetical protein